GGADGEEIVDLPDGGREIGRRHDPADSPAGYRERLAETVYENGAIPHSGQGEQGDVASAAVDDVFVDFIGDGKRVKLLAKFGDAGEFFEIEDASSRVVGTVENNGASPGSKCGA